MIEVQDITKTYENGITALDHFSLLIPEEKRTVFFGPSGCGKTTLLRIIAGVEQPTSGIVNITKNEKVSFMFQDDQLLEDIDVMHNIAYGIDQRKISREDLKNKVFEVSKMIGIETILSQKARSLSGGQRQRVALARALIKEPDLLLIDEGLNSLDQKNKERLTHLLISLQEKKKFTLIYVTHDIHEAHLIAENFVEFKKEED